MNKAIGRAILAGAAAALAGCSWCMRGGAKTEATSPDGLNRIALVRADGAVRITSYRRGVPTLTATFAGLDYLGSDRGPDPARDGIVDVTARATDGVRRTPVYKRAEISLAGNRTTVAFERGWGIELAARNDGVAWRVLTFGDAAEKALIAAERTEFAFPSADCWTWPGYGPNGGKYDRYQWGYQPANEKVRTRDMRVDDGSVATIQCLPLMSENPATGKWATITESDIRDYPSMQLVKPAGDAATVRAVFAPYPAKTEYTGRFYRVIGREGFIAKTSAARAFPWRVTLMGDTPGELTDSDCVAALAQGPDEGADFRWVKPGIVAWDWWNNWNLKGVGFKPGIDTRTYRYYIDFASRHGIPYVILDEGWSEKLDVTKVQKDIDLPDLIRYGRARGVEIILWCAWAQLPGRQDEIFSKYAKMGVRGFKIDFMNRDDQEVVNFLEETARIAAKYRLHVDYHGMFKPYGLEQRYPNVLSYEGVHGLEELKWVPHRDMPVIDCQHYFLRMSAGPMDYTPGAMLNRTREDWKPDYGNPASQGTRCHQVALLPLYFSPLQMMADSPTNYEANEECSRFMAGVPTAWDETRTLGGRPGEWAAVARRKGGSWWIGAINGWEAREVELDLSFLGPGDWTAETFEDAPDAAKEPEHYVRRTDVRPGRTLKVRLAPGGGFAARIENRAAARAARRPLRVVYFTPSDCEPCPDRAERLCRVMKYVQDFYRGEMMRNGYGPMTFDLEETVPGRLKLHEVRGKFRQADYGRDSFDKVRAEVDAVLKAEGLDITNERTVVFQRGLSWDAAGKATEVSSYGGVWTSTWGMCTVYDDPLLDPDNLPSKAPGGSYCGKPCSIGEFNTHYIGGVMHELGHALSLPHDGDTEAERPALGRSIMGCGNHTAGREWRGEGPGTFLSAADALRLSSVSTFRGGEPELCTNDVTLAFKAEETDVAGRLRVKGRVTADRPVKGLIVYVDPDEPKSDYDAQTWIVRPDEDGAFDVELKGVPTTPSELRACVVRDCDTVQPYKTRLGDPGLTGEIDGGKTRPFVQAPFAWHVTPRHDYSKTFVTKLFMAQAEWDPELQGRYKLRDNGKVRTCLTCEQALEAIKGMDALTLGMPKIVYLVGWQYNGHDSKYPAFFEGNPTIKRACDKDALESLRWLMREARKYHTAVSLHVNMFDAYPDSPLFEEYRKADVLAKDRDGNLISGDWGYKISYAAEWAKGLTKKRLDRLLELLPVAEAGTLHIDAFHTSVPRPREENGKWVIRAESPISPGHGYTEADETAAQQELVRYLDSKGVDVTIEGPGEFGSGKAFDGYIPLYYHYGDWDHNLSLLPQQATGVNVYGALRCLGTNLNGEQVFMKHGADIPGALEDFKDQFCRKTLVMNYLNGFGRVSVSSDDRGNGAAKLTDGVRTLWKDYGMHVERNGRRYVEGRDVCLPVPWRNAKSVVVYSPAGFSRRSWPIPEGVKVDVDAKGWTVTPKGLEPFTDFEVRGDKVVLTLAPRQMVLID